MSGGEWAGLVGVLLVASGQAWLAHRSRKAEGITYWQRVARPVTRTREAWQRQEGPGPFPQRRVEGGWTCTVCGQPVDLFAPDQQHPRAFIECRHVTCSPA